MNKALECFVQYHKKVFPQTKCQPSPCPNGIIVELKDATLEYVLILWASAYELTLQVIFYVSADLILVERIILPKYASILVLITPDIELGLTLWLILQIIPPFREHKVHYLLEFVIIVLL